MKLLKTNNFKLLFIMVLMSFSILFYRIIRYESFGFMFLVWNLFLAGVPYIISEYLVQRNNQNIFLFFAILVIWLVFLPNCPYILTDIIHLGMVGPAPHWYDTFLILSFALTGLMFGLVSLQNVYETFLQKFSIKISKLLVIFICFLSGFGVYLGRYLRWNSWDVLNNPRGLGHDIAHRVVYPMDHPRTYFVTLSIGMILTILFLFMNVNSPSSRPSKTHKIS